MLFVVHIPALVVYWVYAVQNFPYIRILLPPAFALLLSVLKLARIKSATLPRVNALSARFSIAVHACISVAVVEIVCAFAVF